MTSDKDLYALYDKRIVWVMKNLCPGCGADNVPMSMDWLSGKALTICPICKCDRTPRGNYDE